MLNYLHEDIDRHDRPICTKLEVPSDYTRLSKLSLNDFTILSQNIRSINCNLDKLLVFIACFDAVIDVIVLSECWTSDKRTPPNIAYYDVFYSKTHLNQNDGIVVYVHTKHYVKFLEPSVNEGNCVIVTIDGIHTLVCSYRPPCYKNVTAYLNSLDSVLSTVHNTNVIFIGDININILPGEITSQGSSYLTLMSYYGLRQAVDKPTAGPNSCIDHVMIKSHKPWATHIFDHLTDHCPILLTIAEDKYVKNDNAQHKSKTNYSAVRETLAAENWIEYFNISDPNIAAETLSNKIKAALSTNSTTLYIPKKRKPLKPWITEGVVRSIRKRNILQRNSSKLSDDYTLRSKYCNYRNICNKVIKTLKREYFQSQLRKYYRDSKNTWKTIKEICNLKSNKDLSFELLNIGNNQTDSMNIVNNYFSSIGKSIADKALNTMRTSDTVLAAKAANSSISPACSFFLFPTNTNEISVMITSLKSSSAPGDDGITSNILKLCKDSLTEPLTHLCNLCFSKGSFPAIFKRAKITPIFKTGDKNIPSNYRPIALISVLSKIIEKLVNKRLMTFLERNALLSNNQYGFRAKLSTEDAVLNLTTAVTNYLDSGERCLGIFLDLQKAFDTVSIPILLSRLENVGIRGTALNFFSSYLSERTQCTNLNKVSSEWLPIEYGVPQGSILAPTLFLIYVNELGNLRADKCKTFMFADDTVLLFHDLSWDLVRTRAEKGLRLVTSWLEDSLLSLNVEKTNYICFSKTTATNPPTDYGVNIHTYPCNRTYSAICTCSPLLRVEHVKYLGIIIDAHLNWNRHINVTTSRVRKLIFTFKNLREVADSELLMQTYKALCECIINYCICSWGGAGMTHMIELERGQRALLKVILRLPFRYPTVDLYNVATVLSVRKLYIMQCLRKYHSKTVPLLPVTTKRIDNCPVPRVKSRFAKKNFSYTAPILYNKLKSKFKSVKKMSNYHFRKTVSQWLYNMNYGDAETIISTGPFGV